LAKALEWRDWGIALLIVSTAGGGNGMMEEMFCGKIEIQLAPTKLIFWQSDRGEREREEQKEGEGERERARTHLSYAGQEGRGALYNGMPMLRRGRRSNR
jgi:hypothetical protein